MKPKNTVGTTIFYLMIFVVVGVLLILFGISMITEEGFAGPFLFLFLVGGLFIFAGIFATISTIKNRPDRNNLKKTGRRWEISAVKCRYIWRMNAKNEAEQEI